MKSSTKSENRKFTIDPDIIFSIIKTQAGALDKALAELIMNSIDAGATQVSLNITDTDFTIEDDGKGFKSKEEIVKWFERFGTKHEEGDAKFGRFRMGRGQSLSFAATVWRSGAFRMEVDIKDKGLDYDLHEEDVVVNGCTITGKFYKPISRMAVYGNNNELDSVAGSESLYGYAPSVGRLINSLTTMVKYVDVPIIVNGILINTPPANEKWLFETEDAYYNLSISSMESQALRIYNMGVYVRSYESWSTGCSGTIVSKKALMVNFARNDILQNECPVTANIMHAVDEFVTDHTIKNSIRNEQQRSFLARRVVDGKIPLDEAIDLKLFTDIKGRHYSVSEINSGWGYLTMPDETHSNAAAEAAHASKQVFVLSPKNLERFECISIEMLYDLLDDTFDFFLEPEFTFFGPWENLYGGFSELIDEKTLNQREQCALVSIRKYQRQIAVAVQKESGNANPRRKILIGNSDHAQAWTNGIDYIALDRKLLKLADKGMSGFTLIAGVITHEYCHMEADTDSHIHTLAFFELFHNITSPGNIDKGSIIGTCANSMTSEYQRLLVTNKLNISAANANELRFGAYLHGKAVLHENAIDIDKAISKIEVDKAEEIVELFDWIHDLEINSEKKNLMYHIARNKDKFSNYNQLISAYVNTEKWGYYKHGEATLVDILNLGLFHALTTRMGIKVPAKAYGLKLKENDLDTKLILDLDHAISYLAKIFRSGEIYIDDDTNDAIDPINPFWFQHVMQSIAIADRYHLWREISALQDKGKTNQLLSLKYRVLCLTRHLNPKASQSSILHGATSSGHKAILYSLIRAAAITNIHNGKFVKEELLANMNLSEDDLLKTYPAVMSKIDKYY